MRVENKRRCPACGVSFRILSEKENADMLPSYCPACGISYRNMMKLIQAKELLKKAQEVLSHYHCTDTDHNNNDVIDMDEEIEKFLEIKE